MQRLHWYQPAFAMNGSTFYNVSSFLSSFLTYLFKLYLQFTLLMDIKATFLDSQGSQPCSHSTTDGKCCSIPFTYKGIKHHSCTTADHNRLWCSLDSTYTGKWGNCGEYTGCFSLLISVSGRGLEDISAKRTFSALVTFNQCSFPSVF